MAEPHALKKTKNGRRKPSCSLSWKKTQAKKTHFQTARFGVVSERRWHPFLRQSHNPLIQAYLDPAAFARFAVRDGDLIWDDYDLCFPVADLYEGRV